jgi:penicillin amidase
MSILLLTPLLAAATPPHANTPPTPLPGLRGEAWVAQDRFGITHIQADDRYDLYFLQGWIHARDRLFQMDVWRRQASGTQAELLGPGALPGDVQMRTFGLRRAAERSLEALSPRTQEWLRAYAEGVNAYVASHPLPSEYAALEITRFEPWTPLDSVAIGKLFSFFLSFDLDIERTLTLQAYQQAGEERGFNGAALFFEDTFRVEPFTHATTVPDAREPAATRVPWRPGLEVRGARPAGAGVMDPATERLARRYLEKASAVPLLRHALERTHETGSNEWVVGGRHTTTGRPILANDPHLALDMPSTFYPIHLRSGSLDVIGSGFAGVPLLLLGHNRRITWGNTTNPLDVTDTYRERVQGCPAPAGLCTVYQGQLEPVLSIPETFRVNVLGDGTGEPVIVPPGGGVPAATLIVPRRNNGPILELDLAAGTALSVQYTGFSATREMDAFLLVSEARNLEEFRAALQYFDVGSQNFMYADVEGNIAYFATAEMPLREDLQAGSIAGLPPSFIREGTGGNEWLPVRDPLPGQAVPYEILPPEEMPHIINPPAGWIVNANNDPIGTTLDNDPLNQLRPGGGIYYLAFDYDGFRAGRITQMIRQQLAGGGKISPVEMHAMQADVVLIDAQFFTPYLVRALERGRESGEPALRALATDPSVAEAITRLARWDFSTPTGIPEGYDARDLYGLRFPPPPAEVDASVAATLYSVWRGQFVRGVIDRTLAAQGLSRLPNSGESLSSLRHLLEGFGENQGVGASGLDFFARPGVAGAEDRRDIALLSAMQDALALLRGPAFAEAFQGSAELSDYRWGLLHRVVFDHPLGPPYSLPPAGGDFPPPLPGLPGIPTDGGFNTVDQAFHSARADSVNGFMFGSGPSHRLVAMPLRQRVVATYELPGGTSGRLESPYFFNLLPWWLTNDAFPLPYRSLEVRLSARSLTRFVPGR